MSPTFVIGSLLISIIFAQNPPSAPSSPSPMNDTTPFTTSTPIPTIAAIATTILSPPTPRPSARPTATPTVSGSSKYANKDIGCNYANADGIAIPMDYCLDITLPADQSPTNTDLSLGAKLVYNPTEDIVEAEVYFSQQCSGRRPLKTFDMTDYIVGFYYDSGYEETTCDEVSINVYQDSCTDESPLGALRLITDQCLYADTNTFMKLQCSETGNGAVMNTYRTSNGDCSDGNLINSTRLDGGSETIDGQDIGCIAIEGCESGVVVTETPTKSTMDPTPAPSRSPVVSTAPPTIDYADQDIGCNYVDMGGGFAMPTDYCMDIILDASESPMGRSMELGMKMVCSDTWDEVTMEIHTSTECDGLVIESFPVSSNSNMSLGFYCDPKYKSASCDEVSINIYMDSGCDSGSYAEIRVITDQCIYAAPGLFSKLECTENSATASMYRSLTGDCSAANLVNSTSLSNDAGEEIDGESIGCIKVEGCSSAASTGGDSGAPSSTIIYIVITILVVIMIVVVLLFAQRHYYKRKMQNVEVLNSNIGDATGIMAVPSTDMDDDKEPQVIFASEDVTTIEPVNAVIPVANMGGEDKEDALLSGQVAGNE